MMLRRVKPLKYSSQFSHASLLCISSLPHSLDLRRNTSQKAYPLSYDLSNFKAFNRFQWVLLHDEHGSSLSLSLNIRFSSPIINPVRTKQSSNLWRSSEHLLSRPTWKISRRWERPSLWPPSILALFDSGGRSSSGQRINMIQSAWRTRNQFSLQLYISRYYTSILHLLQIGLHHD